jgi:hypothetical protein
MLVLYKKYNFSGTKSTSGKANQTFEGSSGSYSFACWYDVPVLSCVEFHFQTRLGTLPLQQYSNTAVVGRVRLCFKRLRSWSWVDKTWENVDGDGARLAHRRTERTSLLPSRKRALPRGKRKKKWPQIKRECYVITPMKSISALQSANLITRYQVYSRRATHMETQTYSPSIG